MSDATDPVGATIEDYLLEERMFPPSEAFKADALVASNHLHEEADQDYQGFWARQAADLLDWQQEWDTICDWQLPDAKWFVGGKLNVSENCLDRHVARRHGATGWRSTGRASPATSGPSPTPTCWPRWSASPTCSRASAWPRATGSPSTCR